MSPAEWVHFPSFQLFFAVGGRGATSSPSIQEACYNFHALFNIIKQ